ncbi:hypothetical protein Hanom_Chr14g01251391 [Helianthus anomalus]
MYTHVVQSLYTLKLYASLLLKTNQMGIHTPMHANQRVVGPTLNDLSVLQHRDTVSITYCRQSVCH